jgi:uncharacterized RDD family membrane protein YckC
METTIIISKFWSRIWALIIDGLILGAFGYLLTLAFQDFFVSIGSYGLILGLVIITAYETIFTSKIMNGQTPGMRVVDIQVVDINGNTISLGKSFVRASVLLLPQYIPAIIFPLISNYLVATLILDTFFYSVAIGIGVFYVFNQATRQSLHDLAVGSYVVSIDRNDQPQLLPAVTPTAFYAFAGAAILFLGFNIYMMKASNPEFENLNLAYKHILKIDGAIQATIWESPGLGNNSKRFLTASISVRKLPTGPNSVERDKIALQAVDLILHDIPKIDSFSFISITLSRNFSIGIARQNASITSSKSPQQWKEILAVDAKDSI